ncbi:hypothetical protein RU96_GL001708 [Enterococcus canintestini]|uniref:Uncharacterized protein n=1 Tax=Enterococcus canintestini TaxID=317010 RepID=A0A1L8R2A3_9ENTE|nr:hypothetical protein RU96_GL001708 [Enterococcus canintestini]
MEMSHMLLRPYKEASRLKIPVEIADVKVTPGQALLTLLCDVNEWLDIIEANPCICGSNDGKAIYVLYRDVAFVISEFWEFFALIMAKINQTWEICAFGTTENQDSIRLSAEKVGPFVELTQQTISGSSSDALRTLCFQLICDEKETADNLLEFLKKVNWLVDVAVMSWRKSSFLKSKSWLCCPKAKPTFATQD